MRRWRRVSVPIGTPTVNKPQIAPWGVYLDYIDASVKPGEDFFAHANGAWLKTVQIPPDRPSAGSGFEVSKQNEERMKEIVVGLKAGADPGSEEGKLRDLHDAFMDEKQIAANGLKPASKDLARIAALKTHEDVAREIALPALPLDGPFGVGITVDDKNPDAYAIRVGQSGIGLPDRDYYLRDDKALLATRAAYKKYLAQMLGFAGVKQPATRAEQVYKLEHELAVASWAAADRREAEKVYNPMPIADLKKLAPEYPWEVSFESSRNPAHLASRGACRDRGGEHRVPRAVEDLRGDAGSGVARLPHRSIPPRIRPVSPQENR